MLAHEVQTLSDLIQRQVAERTGCVAVVGAGGATERLGTISLSFVQALAQISASERLREPPAPAELEQRHGAVLIAKARSYIDTHYADPDIFVEPGSCSSCAQSDVFQRRFRTRGRRKLY